MQHWRWIPNGLSFLRVLLVIPFAWALASGRYRDALLLFAIAAATDGLDGFLARFFGWKSRLGAILGVGETGLAFAQISDTPFIGSGLAPATPLRIARALMDDSAPKPRETYQ